VTTILKNTALLVLLLALLALPSLAATAVRTSYVSIPVTQGDKTWQLAAKLNFPQHMTTEAAVLIVHGSGGVDSRGALHTQSLNNKGLATLEIDLWGARGWVGKQTGRPRGVPETLPDVFAALDFLQHLDGINPDKIGLLGFSWGGVVSMLVRNKQIQARYGAGGNIHKGFAANVAFYPVCWVYNKVPGYELTELRETPLLIQTGEKDDYDSPSSCLDWQATLTEQDRQHVDITVYRNAYHGFNTSAPAAEVTDPFSHQGKGGQVIMKANKSARKRADKATVGFFIQHLVNNSGETAS
jgi:dienelactone hydrolase